MIEGNFYNAFIVELIDFRLLKHKDLYGVKFSVTDTISGKFTKNIYKYTTEKSRLSDEFLKEFLSELNHRIGDYVFSINERGLFHIDERYLLLFNIRPYKRINLNIRRLQYLLIVGQKHLKTRKGTRLLLNNTYLYYTQGYLLVSPVEKSELNMLWYKEYVEQQDYNLVQT
jgi:hypothetical protein